MKAELSNLLMNVEEFLVNGALNKNKLSELARKYDVKLLNLLMKEKNVKNHFFTTLEDGILVFKKDVFLQFLNNKEFLPDSYTAYKTKIGLGNDNGDYISEYNDVVLNFPYKDCILVGGLTKEDTQRQEVFFNKTLALNEINRLLDNKVLTNFKRYDKDGEHEVDSIKENDNFIIKGNNLIALHSLKNRFAGKIKTIFIDPPYYFQKSKPADTFSYNSNFKLSTWLLFLKNRLLVSKELLKENGIIFLSMNDDGVHYLKVIADEIFGIDNFIADITWESRTSISSDGLISYNSNHILIYSKNKETIHKNDFRLALDIENFKFDDGDGRGKYRVEPFDAPNIRKNLSYSIKNPNTGEEYYPPKGRHWRTTEEEYLRLLSDNRIKFGSLGESKPQLKSYYEEVKKSGKGKAVGTIWNLDCNSIVWKDTNTNTSATRHHQEMFNDNLFTAPKPEELIQRIIELSSEKNDIVLDFFMGSGTTQAVAHKMNRQYIGIEQMDYIETISVERLKKVIAGEQGGISKDVEWQGGGSFVYCELKNDAQDFLNKVENALNSEQLIELLEKVKKSSFLSYRVEAKKLNKEEFNNLSLFEQKKLLVELIDQNNLYVNYSDIDDVDNNISEKEKQLNTMFYL